MRSNLQRAMPTGSGLNSVLRPRPVGRRPAAPGSRPRMVSRSWCGAKHLPRRQVLHRTIAAPPTTTGPFQDIGFSDDVAAVGGSQVKAPRHYYRDIAVLAVPDNATSRTVPSVAGPDGAPSMRRCWATIALRVALPSREERPTSRAIVSLTYAMPATIRTASLVHSRCDRDVFRSHHRAAARSQRRWPELALGR